jgi:hypothetical protein
MHDQGDSDEEIESEGERFRSDAEVAYDRVRRGIAWAGQASRSHSAAAPSWSA